MPHRPPRPSARARDEPPGRPRGLEALRRPLRAERSRLRGRRRRDREHHRAERRRQEHRIQRDHGSVRARRRRRRLPRREHRRAHAEPDHEVGHRAYVPDRPSVPQHDGSGERDGRPALPIPYHRVRLGVPHAVDATRGALDPGARPERAGVLRSAAGRIPAGAAGVLTVLREPAPSRDGPGARDRALAAPAGRAHRRHEPARDPRAPGPPRPDARRPRPHHPGDRTRHARGQGRVRPGRRLRLRPEDRRRLVRRGGERRAGDRGVPRDEGGRMTGEDPAPPDAREPVLELRNVSTHYGLVSVLRDVNVRILPGEMVCLLGGNASGKTTTLKTILGYVKPSEGDVLLDGVVVTGLPTMELVARGVSMVPENRRLFANMTVAENLELGGYLRKDKDKLAADREQVFQTFPRVRERLKQKAGTLSGGEQQMVAMGRALMADPKVLLMDEPSMGLAPVLVEQVFEIIRKIRALGKTIFVVEQNANMALSIADRGYVLQTGEIVLSGDAQELLNDPLMRQAYLGEM